MKITEHEMRGLLAGKCLPGDMRLNEDLPSYLMRKFDELQQKLDAMAAENAALKSSIPNLKHVDLDNDNMDDVSLAEDIGFNDAVTLMNRWKGETPLTDAYLNSLRAEGADEVASYHKERFEFLAKTCREASNKHKEAYLAALDVSRELRSGTHDTADKAG